MRTKACFIGGARYSRPLDPTSEKKFRVMKELGELYIIGFSKCYSPQKFTEHAHFYLLPQLPVPFLRYVELFVGGTFLALWIILRHKVQVLIAQSPYEGFAAALTKNIAAWLGRRVVLVVEGHGDLAESLFLYRRILLPRLYRILMHQTARFALNRADLLRAVSNFTRQQLERWAPGKKIVQFRTWTDIDTFFQVGLERDGPPSQKILYVGLLIPLKGIHHLVNAFTLIAQTFPQAQLVIMGREQERIYAGELKARVDRVGLNGRVQFLSETTQTELARWMKRASMLVLPSLSEGLPRVIIEAMACGKPVIGSHVGGIPELIEDGVTGHLVPPGDEVALAERLRLMLEQPQDAQEMGFRAQAFAKHFFSTEAYVQGYREIFERAQSILEGTKPRYASPAF